MLEKNLLAVDLAIATLREQMKDGKIDFLIAQSKLEELHRQRQGLVLKIVAAATERPDETDK